MFKEAFIGIFVLILFYIVCRILWKKNKKILAGTVTACLCIACLSNIIYNGIVMFPNFYMDTVNGPYRYGTFSGNLFAYSDEFMFQDNILFPILKNRSVALDSSAGFYEKFFSLYADSCTTLEVTEENRQAVLAHTDDFDFQHEFTCIGIMDYVTESIPDDLVASFEEEIYPTVFIHKPSLKNQGALTVVMNDDYTLYVMSTAYYQEITGGIPNA